MPLSSLCWVQSSSHTDVMDLVKLSLHSKRSRDHPDFPNAQNVQRHAPTVFRGLVVFEDSLSSMYLRVYDFMIDSEGCSHTRLTNTTRFGVLCVSHRALQHTA